VVSRLNDEVGQAKKREVNERLMSFEKAGTRSVFLLTIRV